MKKYECWLLDVVFCSIAGFHKATALSLQVVFRLVEVVIAIQERSTMQCKKQIQYVGAVSRHSYLNREYDAIPTANDYTNGK